MNTIVISLVISAALLTGVLIGLFGALFYLKDLPGDVRNFAVHTIYDWLATKLNEADVTTDQFREIMISFMNEFLSAKK